MQALYWGCVCSIILQTMTIAIYHATYPHCALSLLPQAMLVFACGELSWLRRKYNVRIIFLLFIPFFLGWILLLMIISKNFQLIDVQAEVLEKEKELQRAREKLAALRKEKYKHAELDDSDRMF